MNLIVNGRRSITGDTAMRLAHYFGTSAQHITHTGMYLGNGKFINATTWQTPAVQIDELDDPHWTRLLVAIRRVK